MSIGSLLVLLLLVHRFDWLDARSCDHQGYVRECEGSMWHPGQINESYDGFLLEAFQKKRSENGLVIFEKATGSLFWCVFDTPSAFIVVAILTRLFAPNVLSILLITL